MRGPISRATRSRLAWLIAASWVSAGYGCSGDEDHESKAERRSATIGPAGGSLQACGATLTVPSQALASDTTLTISCVQPATVNGFTLLSALFTFEPAELVFDKGVTVSIPFNGTASHPDIFWSRLGSSGFDRIGAQRVGSMVIGTVVHFSVGFVAESAESDASSDGGPAEDGQGDDGGASDRQPDDGVASDAACLRVDEPPTQGVPCGTAGACTGQLSACCPGSAPGCVPPSEDSCKDAGGAGAVIRCDGPEDCAGGESCCSAPNTFCAIGCALPAAFYTVCHADADCPPSDPICGIPMFVHLSTYSVRTCTRACSSSADCGDAATSFGYCYADQGCAAATCHAQPAPVDAGVSDANDSASPPQSGCITPVTPGRVPCGSTWCNTEAQFCCGGAGCLNKGHMCTAGGISCDGPEDCATSTCHGAGSTVACNPNVGWCANGPGFSCSWDTAKASMCVCHSAIDCPPSFPYCYVSDCSYSVLPLCHDGPPKPDAGVEYGPCSVADAAAPPVAEITCGNTTCSNGTVCCFGSTPQCQPASATCYPGIKQMCDGPEDCVSGERCCANDTPMVFCSPDCGGDHPVQSNGIVCHTTSDCPSTYPNCTLAFGTVKLCAL